MTISEVCQFELKEEVDKLKNDNPGLSLAECIRQTVQFYESAGIEIKEETARTKYKRASVVGSNEPINTTTCNKEENAEKQKIQTVTEQSLENAHAPGPGRPPKHSLKLEPQIKRATTAMQLAVVAISQLERITDDDPLHDEALIRVLDWIRSKLHKE